MKEKYLPSFKNKHCFDQMCHTFILNQGTKERKLCFLHGRKFVLDSIRLTGVVNFVTEELSLNSTDNPLISLIELQVTSVLNPGWVIHRLIAYLIVGLHTLCNNSYNNNNNNNNNNGGTTGFSLANHNPLDFISCGSLEKPYGRFLAYWASMLANVSCT